jgi:pimeloyl-ACP methyl ester carboxylesterase
MRVGRNRRSGSASRRRNGPFVALAAAGSAGLLLGGCAAAPPQVDRYEIDMPAGVTDARGRFREIFCAVLEQHGTELPDYRPCEQALTPVEFEPAGRGEQVPLGTSRRRLVVAFVPGVGYGCIASWLRAPAVGANHLLKYDYGQILLEVDSLSGIETNARQIRDSIMAMPEEAGPPRLVLVGYSKGAPDILEAVVRYPEIRDRVAAVVSLAGAVGGSALAKDMKQYQAELFRYWPGADCDKGDGDAVASLRPDVRKAWLTQNPLPQELYYYSLVTLPTPERISRVIEKSYRDLGRIDWRNNSQLIYYDQVLPGSTLVGFLNADHWAVAIPVNRSHPAIARSFVDQNAYPREALLEAMLRFIEEDLDRRPPR